MINRKVCPNAAHLCRCSTDTDGKVGIVQVHTKLRRNKMHNAQFTSVQILLVMKRTSMK